MVGGPNDPEGTSRTGRAAPPGGAQRRLSRSVVLLRSIERLTESLVARSFARLVVRSLRLPRLVVGKRLFERLLPRPSRCFGLAEPLGFTPLPLLVEPLSLLPQPLLPIVAQRQGLSVGLKFRS